MDLETVLTEVRSWPVAERLRLIEEVWEELSDENSEPQLTEGIRAHVDRRLEGLDAESGEVLSWDEIKAYVRRPR